MATVMFKGEVKDYEAWKPVFDGLEEKRKSLGETSYRILREENGGHGIVILIDWDTVEHAHMYLDSPELKEALRRGGARKLEIALLREAERHPEMEPVFSDLM
jgi:heme-degrading monooxygenase HmoA